MRIAKTLLAAREFSVRANRPLALVPTMGALHDGHARLIRRARDLVGADGTVVVTVFVNPIQFGPHEDLGNYPRPFSHDLEICRRCGADLVFGPSVEQMYREGHSVFVEENSLSRYLCGASRPGHFRGVCTVVAKLFILFRPELAIFGEKDWQQLAIIRKMVQDLNFSVRIVGHPTIRELDGLAISSRNAYLTSQERAVAPGIYAALKMAVSANRAGDILRTGRRMIEEISGAKIDYLELVNAETIEPTKNFQRPLRLAVAVFLGKARLIDNIAVPPRP